MIIVVGGKAQLKLLITDLFPGSFCWKFNPVLADWGGGELLVETALVTQSIDTITNQGTNMDRASYRNYC